MTLDEEMGHEFFVLLQMQQENERFNERRTSLGTITGDQSPSLSPPGPYNPTFTAINKWHFRVRSNGQNKPKEELLP